MQFTEFLNSKKLIDSESENLVSVSIDSKKKNLIITQK